MKKITCTIAVFFVLIAGISCLPGNDVAKPPTQEECSRFVAILALNAEVNKINLTTQKKIDDALYAYSLCMMPGK